MPRLPRTVRVGPHRHAVDLLQKVGGGIRLITVERVHRRATRIPGDDVVPASELQEMRCTLRVPRRSRSALQVQRAGNVRLIRFQAQRNVRVRDIEPGIVERLGRGLDAERLVRPAIVLLEDQFGDGYPTTATTCTLGRALHLQDRNEEAAEIVSAALRSMEGDPGVPERELRACREAL